MRAWAYGLYGFNWQESTVFRFDAYTSLRRRSYAFTTTL